MEIRNTALEEIDSVMNVYANAREFMRNSGNLTQWVNGYPGLELITKDILNGNSYVCIDCSQIIGVFTFIQGIDPTYVKIYEGKWLNDEPYGVVHRIAAAINKKGVASYCLNWCLSKYENIRIDTHRDNIAMQNLLVKNGFLKCGIIFLEDGSERLAYQKIIR